MYGKIFESLYEGSMIGGGASLFAVWGYVIAKMKPDKEVGAQVDLNPQLLAFVLGETLSEVERVIEVLCSPDPKSRTPDEEGRRLIQIGQYTYRVVNGAKYMNIRNAEERREYFREAKRKERATAKEMVTKAVNGDPITKADKKNFKKRFKTVPVENTTATQEYDLDYPQ